MCVIPPKHLLRAKGSAHHQLSICISFYRGKLLKTANFPHHCQLPHHATAPSLPHQRAGRHFLGGGRRAVAPPTVNPYRVPAPFFLFWLPSPSSSSSSCPPSLPVGRRGGGGRGRRGGAGSCLPGFFGLGRGAGQLARDLAGQEPPEDLLARGGEVGVPSSQGAHGHQYTSINRRDH